MPKFLETEQLIIRAPLASDLDDWCKVSPGTREEVTAFLQRSIKDYERFGFSMGTMIEKSTGKFVGRAGLYFYFAPDVKQDIEIGCFIDKDFRNRGIGTEITTAMIDWAFKYLRVNRLTGLTPVNLINSHLVLERSGMRRAERLQVDGEDVFLYEVHRGSWAENYAFA